ncbi:MAG TPA: tripartite tricarboxylate transporter substrate-binding protein, partial [Burkholderiales bacterium]|nr:tripartite tricarboxylate transporter substrate-binding protein [Burkholderiales bacterium]
MQRLYNRALPHTALHALTMPCRAFALLLASAFTFLFAPATHAQAPASKYPSKPVRMITSGAGGGSDFTIRLIAQALAGPLGQQVLVDNRPGVVSVEVVAKSPPDGYTLLFYGSAVWIEPLLR